MIGILDELESLAPSPWDAWQLARREADRRARYYAGDAYAERLFRRRVERAKGRRLRKVARGLRTSVAAWRRDPDEYRATWASAQRSRRAAAGVEAVREQNRRHQRARRARLVAQGLTVDGKQRKAAA